MGLKADQISESSNNKISLWLFIYALNYAFFHIMPAFLNFEIKNRLMLGDLLDFFTPLVIIFILIKLYSLIKSRTLENSNPLVNSFSRLILILGGVVFIEGHGIHLSANTIARNLIQLKGTALYNLTYFFDEIFSHILWDSGFLLLSFGLILMGLSFNQKKMENQKPILILFSSLLYGFTYFVNAIEGQTVFFTLPLAIIIPLVILGLAHRRNILFTHNTVLSFYFFAYLLSVVLFAFWGIWNRGFPQFSELGWI